MVSEALSWLLRGAGIAGNLRNKTTCDGDEPAGFDPQLGLLTVSLSAKRVCMCDYIKEFKRCKNFVKSLGMKDSVMKP